MISAFLDLIDNTDEEALDKELDSMIDCDYEWWKETRDASNNYAIRS